jgi:hypothetical protein
MRRILFSLILFCGCRTYNDAVKWGDSSVGSDTAATDADGDGWSAASDCDDEDPYIHPEADEICNGIDDDCNGVVDDNALDALSWYVDSDGDGYGDESTEERSCESISGSVEAVPEGFDCDDQNPEIHPGALETDCSDPTDYNCDGSVTYDDVDGDGWSACEECDDSDAAINPDAIEVCDEVDNDCDGDIDDEDDGVDLETGSTWYADTDGDGYGTGDITITACVPPTGYLGDNTDCDDADADIHPAAIEICDGIDNDCDGDIDDEDANVDLSGGITFYADFDEDGFGDPDDSVLQCEAPSGYVTDGSDCDDADSDTWPGAEEYCDGEDNDCDGDIDEDDALDASTWYQDADGDAYGNAAETTSACEEPSGYVSDDTDCDDTDGATWPGAEEYCDGHDDDCDGDIDEDSAVDVSTWYADSDGDGYGSTSSSTTACDQPSGYAASADDCDDGDSSVYPGASEVCDGLDNDCDGTTDSTTACGCYVEYYGSDPYLFCTSSQSWDSANSTCQSLGYHLITIGDGSENSWADSTADSYSTSKWHMGFTDQWSEGNWQWADGSSVTYTNWQSGEPNGGTSESCGQLNRYHPTTTWNDEPCSQSLNFICEYN